VRLRTLRIGIAVALGAVFCGASTLGFAWWRVAQCRNLAHDETAALPYRKVALVLGCSRTLGDGSANYFFTYRMDAAAELIKSGKADYLLVSGDNRRHSYDEPTMMKEALIARGVPSDRVVCDFAGLTTLDSVVRAKAVFGQPQITIVSQRFHAERAIYLARAYGVDAVGFNARDIPLPAAPRTYTRELLSRVRAVLDANILRRQPRHLGEPVVIGSSVRA